MKLIKAAFMSLSLLALGCQDRGYSTNGDISCHYWDWGENKNGITYYDPINNGIYITREGKLWTYQPANMKGNNIDIADADGRARNRGEHSTFDDLCVTGSECAVPLELKVEELKLQCTPGVYKRSK